MSVVVWRHAYCCCEPIGGTPRGFWVGKHVATVGLSMYACARQRNLELKPNCLIIVGIGCVACVVRYEMPDNANANDLPPAYDGVLTSDGYDGYDSVLTSTSTSQPEGFELAQDEAVDSDLEL